MFDTRKQGDQKISLAVKFFSENFFLVFAHYFINAAVYMPSQRAITDPESRRSFSQGFGKRIMAENLDLIWMPAN